LLNLRAIQAEKARRSLATFVRQAWHVIEPETGLKWSWVLDAICEHVQALLEDRLIRDGRVIRNLAINVPPGTMKSTILSVGVPAWKWTKTPAWRGLFASGNDDVALRDSVKCRLLLDSDWYRQTFKPKWTFTRDQNAKGHYVNTKTGFRQAISAGAIVVGQRADDLLVDDPNSTSGGEADRAKVVNWWDNAAWSRLNDLAKGHRIVIQQRVHEEDLTGHIQEKYPEDWAFLVIRMRYEVPTEQDPGPAPTPLRTPNPTPAQLAAGFTPDGWIDPRRTEGELMFPERFPEPEVRAQEKVLGTAGTAGQLQQRPAPKDGLIFKTGFVRRFKGDALPEFTRRFFSCDTAFSKERTADYSVILVAAECNIPGFMGLWLLDVWRKQASFPELEQAVIDMNAKYHVDTLLIEKKASGQSLIQALEVNTPFPVVPVEVSTDKPTRGAACASTWEAGRIWIPEDAPWVMDFLTEVYAFPNGKHDDQVDSLTQLIKHAFLDGGDGWLSLIDEDLKGKTA
jgi:predicted phage terminase large subunit-like protein